MIKLVRVTLWCENLSSRPKILIKSLNYDASTYDFNDDLITKMSNLQFLCDFFVYHLNYIRLEEEIQNYMLILILNPKDGFLSSLIKKL